LPAGHHSEWLRKHFAVCGSVVWALAFQEYREVMELFNAYTRLVFGATMILAALCVLIEQIGGAL